VVHAPGRRREAAAQRSNSSSKEPARSRLAEVRNSDEYRKAYDSVVDFVSRIDEHNVKRFCAETPIAR